MSEFRKERITTLTQTAKGVWFGYLGALAFTGVTILGVEDIDFFSLESATELPLIGVSVPVTSFFWAGALLLAIVYCYLHVFLEQLWVELANAPARLDKDKRPILPTTSGDFGQITALEQSTPISQHIHPWLLSEFALIRRASHRRETPPPIEMSPLGYFGIAASAFLGWIAGPAVLFCFWLWSHPAHDFLLTSILAIAFWATLWAMLESWYSLVEKMDGPGKNRGRLLPALWRRCWMVGLLSLMILTSSARTVWDPQNNAERVSDHISVKSYLTQLYNGHFRNEFFAEFFRPVPARLVGANLVELPANWLARDTAMKDFYAKWCKRPDTEDCRSKIPNDNDHDFQKEWKERYEISLRVLSKPKLHDVDLSFANLVYAHLPGLDLRDSNLNGAKLRHAKAEGANLSRARMEGADLSKAKMAGTILSHTKMAGAKFERAQMEGAQFYQAQLGGANFRFALLRGADFRFAQMRRTALSFAQMERADLSFSTLTGSSNQVTNLEFTNLNAVKNNGGAIRFVDFTEAIIDDLTDFRNSFGDASVKLPTAMSRPCQWGKENDEQLEDAEFYGKWRGWVEPHLPSFPDWEDITPEEFWNVTPIDPPDGCEWKTEPITASTD